ncbi:MAG: HAD-IIB family hydrolase, partial [Clostridia bacterium]|nr:HAD-IIB family hydrolase [Clostridia bacterium]
MHEERTAVLLDLDGTLLTNEKNVLPSSISAIRKLREKGREVVLISARSPSGIRPILSDIGLRLPMICLGGGYALDEDGVVLFSEGFS